LSFFHFASSFVFGRVEIAQIRTPKAIIAKDHCQSKAPFKNHERIRADVAPEAGLKPTDLSRFDPIAAALLFGVYEQDLFPSPGEHIPMPAPSAGGGDDSLK
jgi:hypothetical protein